MGKKLQLAPYLLILPSIIYLGAFFLWPMFRALQLAVWNDDGRLALLEESNLGSSTVGYLAQGVAVNILNRQLNVIPPEDVGQPNQLTENWYKISGEDPDGEVVEGWASSARIRVREEADDGTPISGTVRGVISTTADPQTSIFSEPNDRSQVIFKLDPTTPVTILETAVLETWFQVEGEGDDGLASGWVQSRYIQAFSSGEAGRVDRGNAGLFTMEYIRRMVNDRFFRPAVGTTALLLVIIVPVQFVLAIIMALVVQSRLRGSNWFLYIFAIPLGVSDLAVGIVWYGIFTQFGYLNSILQGLGLISSPVTYLSAGTRNWIIVAIWAAEVWRATSIVMIIVVSGLQAISDEVLEAAELFGASLWQRVRFVILPLLKPSLQVALILRTILALQVFAVVIALSGGQIVTVLANETYRQYFTLRNPNVAAAYAGFILLVSMVIAVIYLRLVRTQEEAAG